MRRGERSQDLFGLADQALISATSFFTLLILARVLSASAFGTFALAYTALILINSLQSALVTQPHNVIGAAHRDEAYTRFTATTLIAQLLFLLITVLALVAAGLITLGLGGSAAELLLAMVPATIAWQLQELARRILYTESRLRGAFLSDSIAYGGQILGLAALWQTDRLDGVNTLYVIAASSLLGAVIGFAQVRDSVGSPERGHLASHWDFGKWLAAGVLGHGVSAYVYFYVAAILLGTAASGELRASQLVLGPLNVMLIFFATVLPIRLSQTLTFSGEEAYWARLRTTLVATAPIVALYCLLASIFATPLLDLFFEGRYAQAQVLVVLFAVYYFLSYLGQMAISALNARQQTKPVFFGYFAGAASAMLFVWLFIEAWGVQGAALGMVISVVLSDLTLLMYLRRARKLAHGQEACRAQA